MSFEDWGIDEFKKVDVRGVQGDFFQGLKKQAMQIPEGEGIAEILAQ